MTTARAIAREVAHQYFGTMSDSDPIGDATALASRLRNRWTWDDRWSVMLEAQGVLTRGRIDVDETLAAMSLVLGY